LGSEIQTAQRAGVTRVKDWERDASKGQHCVFLYSDALGWMCDRTYHDGSEVQVKIPLVFTSGFQLVVRGLNMTLHFVGFPSSYFENAWSKLQKQKLPS
jgi:hypothetical protein